MRPQHITAENAMSYDGLLRVTVASMRPQHITAENTIRWSCARVQAQRFNEAAAYHCGKPPA